MTWSPPLQHHELQTVSKGACYPPRYGRVAQDLVLGYALLAIIVATNVLAAKANLGIATRLFLVAISSLAVSVLLHYLFLFVHEAAHYHLFSSKVNNDRWSNLLVCYW